MNANRRPRIDCWIVLAPTGRHVTISRIAAPEREEDFAAILAGLERVGFSGGWLATLDGAYAAQRSIRLTQVRPIGHPGESWAIAGELFAARRLYGSTLLDPDSMAEV